MSFYRHNVGVTRRELLQVGYSSMAGIGLSSMGGSSVCGAPVPGQASRARTVLFIYLIGAPSQIDSIDPKPDAPVEVRGDFQTIATRVTGVRFCEHLPLMAGRADRFAIVRTMTQGEKDHERGSHTILTGHDELPAGATNLASRRDWPCFAGGLDFLRITLASPGRVVRSSRYPNARLFERWCMASLRSL